MKKTKKLLLGIALILFGSQLQQIAELGDIWLRIPIISGWLHGGVLGLIFAIIGLCFLIAGCFAKKQ